jgi:Bacteriophage tail assembly protein
MNKAAALDELIPGLLSEIPRPREVNVVKSARVGYSKMLLGVYAYFIEHKQRNTLIWLPTDGDAENFMKTHVEPTIRDIPSLLALAPGLGPRRYNGHQ